MVPLALTYPRIRANPELTRILFGAFDHYTGIDPDGFTVVADFDVDGRPAGTNLAPDFRETSTGVRELRLRQPITSLPRGKIVVSVRDRQGNVTRIERTFSVRPEAARP